VGPVAGDADLEVRGLVIFDELFLSSIGELARGGEVVNSFFPDESTVMDLISEAPRDWLGAGLTAVGGEAGFPDPNCMVH